jgi:uncharacterized protein (DUF1800 family)
MTRRSATLSQLLLAGLALFFLASTAYSAPPQLLSAVSRMTQGASAFDIQLPLSGGTGIECRGLFNGVTIVLTFDQPVVSGDASVVPGSATVNGFAGNTMSVTVAGLADSQAMALTVSNVANAGAETLASATVNMRTLLGDVNGSGSVTGADVNIAKAQVGAAVDGSNFRTDVGGNGSISGADTAVIKSKIGTTIAGGKTDNTPPTIGNIPDQNTAADTATLPIGFAVGDAESAVDTLAVSATSSNQTIVPNAGIAIGGSGASRTVSVTPAAGQTGNVVITVRVSDGLASTIDTFVLSVGSPTKLYLASLRPGAGIASSGWGTSSLILSGDETEASINFAYSNLSTARTGIEVRGPADAGQVGSILFNIQTATPEADGSYKWTITDVGSVTAAQIVEAIKAGQVYLNVSTTKYAQGELRGQYLFATGSQTFTPPPPPPALPGGPPTPQDAQRFLTQATFGPSSADINNLVTVGFDAWLNDQFTRPTTSMYDQVYQRCTQSASANDELTGARITESWWRIALSGQDQLRQKVAFAYSEIFVVSKVEDAIDAQPAGLCTYQDMLANDAFVNFRQILEDVTLHPIMGQYLNMRGNRKPVSPTFLAPNENYAREVLQLFSIGLNAMHPDGTVKLDANGLPIVTYDQSTIEAFAHVFTGWDVDPTPVVIPTLTATGVVNVNSSYNKPMTVRSANHSNNAKVLLNGFTLPANATHTTISSNAELELALDNIFFHPNVGPFMARRLIQRLVTSNPSPAYIYRVAKVFDDDGTGVRGNMRAVIRAILMDYEARTTELLGNQGYGKIREPVVRVSAIIRGCNGVSTINSAPFGNIWKMSSTDTQLAQTPYRSPTVFNFFEPDYIANGDGGLAGLYAPEMQIITETTAIGAANYVYSGIYSGTANATTGVCGGWPGPNGNDVRLNLAAQQAIAANATTLVENLNQLFMAGQMTTGMRDRIVTYINTLPSTTTANRLARAQAAVHLVVTSPQFTTQR